MREIQTALEWKQPCPVCKHPLTNHTKGYCDTHVDGITPGDLYACGCKALKTKHITIYYLND